MNCCAATISIRFSAPLFVAKKLSWQFVLMPVAADAMGVVAFAFLYSHRAAGLSLGGLQFGNNRAHIDIVKDRHDLYRTT